MTLIKCIECEKEFSSRADSCPQCGCPVEESIINNLDKMEGYCEINGQIYDLQQFIDINHDNYANYYGRIIKQTNLSYNDASDLCDLILNTHQIPKEFNGETRNYIPPTIITCPYCNSSNVKKIGVGGRILSTATLGLAGKVGKQWHCNSCKSDF